MTSGTWKTIGLEIYESDDLGNLGTWIATARDITVAARMADTHNSMLAALKDVKQWLGADLFMSGDVHETRCVKSIDLIRTAIAKAEGTKP